MNHFDTYGWYSQEPIEGRTTEVALPAQPWPDGHQPNFTGYVWVLAPYSPPPEPVVRSAEDLATARAKRWEDLKVERDRRTAGGVKVGSYWFHSDSASRIQQLGLVMMGAAVPAVQWKTMSGEKVTMSQTLANQIFSASAASDMAIFAQAEAHKASMEASDNPEHYDITTGWPETYGG